MMEKKEIRKKIKLIINLLEDKNNTGKKSLKRNDSSNIEI